MQQQSPQQVRHFTATSWPEMLVLVTFCLSLLGYWDFLGWFADLPSHFKVQFAVLQFLGLGGLLIRRKFQWVLLALLGLGMNIAEVLPVYFEAERLPFLDKVPIVARFKLLQMNVERGNTHFDQAVNLIQTTKPDVIALNEVDQNWLEQLKPALVAYPYFVERTRDDSMGIAIYSRIPLVKTKIVSFLKKGPYGKTAIPSALAALRFQNQIVTILATHPLAPITPLYFEARNRSLQAIAESRPSLGRHLIVVGDLNTSPYSGAFKRFLVMTGLRDSRQGFGIQPTWPSFFFPMWISIDHILLSDHFVVLSRQVGTSMGSDHLPVLAEIGLLGDTLDASAALSALPLQEKSLDTHSESSAY